MGCTVSKESESSSDGRDDAFLSKEDLALQLAERSLQSTERRYIAILSANYGMLSKAGIVKSIARRDLLMGSGDSGDNYASKTARRDLALSNNHAKRPEARILQKFLSDKESLKATEGFVGEPETINTWELMEGLEDDVESSSLSSKSLLLSSPTNLPASKPIFASSSNPFYNDLLSASTPPHFRSKIRSFEDVEAAMAATRSCCPHPHVVSQVSSKINHQISGLGNRFVERASSEIATIPRTKLVQDVDASYYQWSSWNPDILHKAHARKYVPEHSSTVEYHGFSRRAGSFSSQGKSGSTRVSLEFLRRLSEDPDTSSSRSSSEFSTRNSQLSFQDWLLDSCASKQPDLFQSTVRRSLLRNFEDKPRHQSGKPTTYAASPERLLCTKSKRTYGGSTYKTATDALEESLSKFREPSTFSKQTEKCQKQPVFDPEFLESVEKAMEQLSEKEWHAKRNKEDHHDQLINAEDNWGTKVGHTVGESHSMKAESISEKVSRKFITEERKTSVIHNSVDHKNSCICRGGKFLICHICQGRRLVVLGDGSSSCRHCSGTGLIKCSNCSS